MSFVTKRKRNSGAINTKVAGPLDKTAKPQGNPQEYLPHNPLRGLSRAWVAFQKKYRPGGNPEGERRVRRHHTLAATSGIGEVA